MSKARHVAPLGMGASLHPCRPGLPLLGWGSLSLPGGLDRSCQLLVFGVGLWASYRAHPGQGAPPDYLLAGRDVGWVPVGTALVASSSGSEHIVVHAGKQASSGVEVARFEILSSVSLFLFGWVFVPSNSGAGSPRWPAPSTDFRPWKGVLSGAPIPLAWYRCTDRCVVQGSRVRRRSPMLAGGQSLAAPSVHLRHARRRCRQSFREWGHCARCTWRRASGARCGSPHWPVPPARHCRAGGGPRELILIAALELVLGLASGELYLLGPAEYSLLRAPPMAACSLVGIA